MAETTPTPAKPKKPKKPKFKHTRQLVRIAIQDGMTQKEIGDLGRVEQSVVSSWLNGKTLAFEHQVAELRKRYGHRLNRVTSRVYLVGADRGGDGKADGDRIVRVEGAIVFRYTFCEPDFRERGKTWERLRVPVGRLHVHHPARGQFVLVQLRRRRLSGAVAKRWHDELRRAAFGDENRYSYGDDGLRKWIEEEAEDAFVECADDAGRWRASIEGPMDVTTLLARCDALKKESSPTWSLHDELTVPFLLRKMLVENGFDVPGVEHMVAPE